LIEARLLALRQQIEGHFQVALQGCVTPQFLRYRKGDFYIAPRDNRLAKQRQISVVVFLNDHALRHQALDFYDGGDLTFYRLIDDNPRWTNIGLPLTSEEGLLIAFRSQVVHEVTPVTRGERYTIVNWFF
jgi:SM-20-related protein